MTLPDPAHRPDPAPARRPPRVLSVVRELGTPEEVDWSSWILTDEDDMGQHPRQSEAIRVFRDVAVSRLAELGRERAFVGTDAFFAWVEAEPLVRVSPDVFVLTERPEPLPPSWQLWRAGHAPPQLAVEIVSEDWKKDYEDAPQKYAQLGAEELVIFDPDAVDREPPRPGRCAIQVFRRSSDGLFLRVHAGTEPARIQTLEAFAVVARTEIAPVLRLAYDADGRGLVPTPAEKAARERDEAARERDEERALRLALEARLAALEGKG